MVGHLLDVDLALVVGVDDEDTLDLYSAKQRAAFVRTASLLAILLALALGGGAGLRPF